MAELSIPGFKGVGYASQDWQYNKSDPGTLAVGDNIALDAQGNAYVCTGFRAIGSTITGNGTSLFYSGALDRIVTVDASGTPQLLLATDGTTTSGSAGFASGARVVWADWPTTGLLYGSDGTTYKSINSSGTVTTVGGGLAGTILCTHKNHVFSVGASGYNANLLQPSNQLDPTTFTPGDGLAFNDGGSAITALLPFNGVLHVHKPTGIWAVYGDTFSGAYKDPQIVATNSIRGAIGQYAVCSLGDFSYFMGYDGVYRFDGHSSPQRISDPVSWASTRDWRNLSADTVGPRLFAYTPFYGPDRSARYVVVMTVFSGYIVLWCYNVDTQDWHRRITYLSNVDTATHDPNTGNSYMVADKVYKFDNCEKNGTGTITGTLITNPMVGASQSDPHVTDKIWTWAFEHPIDYNGISVYAGMDGLYPTIPISPASGDSAVELPRQLAGHQMALRFQQTGGGRAISNGITLQYEAVSDDRRRRSYAQSRKASLAYVQANYPILLGGFATLTNGVTSYTVNHGMSDAPEAVMLTPYGFHPTQRITLTYVDASTFQFTINGYTPTGGERVYWVAQLPYHKKWYDSYSHANRFAASSSPMSLSHNLDVAPNGVFVQQWAAPTYNLQVTFFDARRMSITLASSFPNSSCNLLVAANGTTDTYFKCGSATSSPITHGLGRTPTSVILFQNNSSVTGYGVDSITSTQITYTGTGSYYWFAM